MKLSMGIENECIGYFLIGLIYMHSKKWIVFSNSRNSNVGQFFISYVTHKPTTEIYIAIVIGTDRSLT